jgi:hypothetical protein
LLNFILHLFKQCISQLQTLAKELDLKLDKVMILEEQVKMKERKILDRGEEILAMEMKVLARVNEIARTHDVDINNERK